MEVHAAFGTLYGSEFNPDTKDIDSNVAIRIRFGKSLLELRGR